MADSSPVAHEGNPKEDSITVSGGSVLSTATLDIIVPGFVPPPFVPPPVDSPPNPSEKCTFTSVERPIEQCNLNLRVLDRYDLGSYAAFVDLHGSFIGCSGTPSGGFVFQPTTPLFNLDVLSGRHDLSTETQGSFAGFTIAEGIINASHLGDFLSCNTLYTLTSGSPVVGFCFWVSIASTPCEFTGMVAINDVPNNRTYLGYFYQADLHSDPPTILATGALCPSGDVFNFFNDISAHTFELSKTSGNLISSNQVATVVPSLIPNNPNWGFIWLPNNAAGVHQAKLQYGFSPWDIT